MIEDLKDIRNKLENGIYQNEEHVRLCVVARILQQLGWNIWNPNEVNAEFKVVPNEDYTRVDIALFLNSFVPSVFIEIKPVGKIESELHKIEQQLRDYNRNNTAQFSVITDGRKWRFYYSQTGGEFSQKCFKVLDVIKDDLESLEFSLKAFLSKNEILNGNAKTEAESYLNLNLKQRAMEDALPKARRLVLEPPFPSLPQAIMNIVSQAGFQITLEEAVEFVKQNTDKKFTPELYPPKSPENVLTSDPLPKPFPGRSFALEEIINQNLVNSKPDRLYIGNNEISVKSWSELSLKFVSWLIDNGYLTKSSVPIYIYSKRDKYFINTQPKHENPNRDGLWERVGDFFVDTKYNAESHVKNLRSTLEQLKINNLDIKISLK